MDVGTSAACPTTADSYNVIVNGPGGFNDFPMVSTTTVGISHNGPFSAPFRLTMRDAAGLQGVAPGEYDVTLQCVDGFTLQQFGTFTTAMYFTSPTAYTTTNSTTNPTPSPTSTPTPGATATTTTLKVSSNRAFQGIPIIFLANVAPRRAAGAVQFRDGTTALGAPVQVTTGFALTVATLPKGTHSLTAVFIPTNPRFCSSPGRGRGAATPCPGGPAIFAPSASAPVSLTVQPISAGLGPR